MIVRNSSGTLESYPDAGPAKVAGMTLLVAQTTNPETFSKAWWLSVGISLAILIIAALIVTLLARRFVHRLLKKAEAKRKAESDHAAVERQQRTATVARLLLGTLQIVIWSIVVLIVLDSIGVRLGPLLAGAGIIGVALGFGAQTIVRDTLSGFFILAEDQYDVGDTVELQTTGGPVAGTVESLTLRVTNVRSFDGTLNTVPNGNINVTSNRTRGWGRAIVDIRLSFDEDVEKVRVVLAELFDDLGDAEPFASGLRASPEVLGVVQLAVDAQILRVTAETVPSRRFEIERDLRERVTTRLTERGINLPASSVVAAPPHNP
jgi:moderate conductance mechanosensitive channel